MERTITRLAERVAYLPMRIIPVLDLMNGCVVRGVAGRREEYQPIRSELVDGHAPAGIADALRRRFGLNEFYVADLDALRGGTPQWHVLRELIAAGHELLVDAGVRDASLAAELLVTGVTRVVTAQESLPGRSALQEVLGAIGAPCAVYSLDLLSGQLLGPRGDWRSDEPFARAAEAIECGAEAMIVLDLAGVGVGQGVPTLELCTRLRRHAPQLEIITGGGVRHRDDLLRLRDAGVDAVLVASALHDRRIAPADLDGLSAWHV